MAPPAAAEAPGAVAWIVEEAAGGDAYFSRDTLARAYRSACFTLTLGVLGSSVLPLPFAICKTGVLLGGSTMLVVAWTNVATSTMLIRAYARTGRHTYEGLAEWAGGPVWRTVTQVSLLALLWGTLCGGLCMLSDVAVVMADQAFPGGQAPRWLSGRVLMSGLALLVVLPLCLQRHMRQLETAATAGVGLVLGLVVLLAAEAAAEGFPGIASGDVPLWTLRVDGHLPEAFSVLAFAFYMQPMMMALLPEMPAGAAGVDTMVRAVRSTLYGGTLAIYAATGLFGAALFGQDTQGNIMANRIVSGRMPTLLLYGGMLLYLALAMTTTQYALKQSLDLLLLGEEGPPFTMRRQVVLTGLSIGSALAVALIAPGAAEKIISVVGATGVCMVSYVIPVAVQLAGHSRGWAHPWRSPDVDAAAAAAGRYLAWHRLCGCGGAAGAGAVAPTGHGAAGDVAGGLTAPLLAAAFVPAAHADRGGMLEPSGCDDADALGAAAHLAAKGDEEHGWGGVCGGPGLLGRAYFAWEGVVEPVVVLAIGVGFSVAALWVAVATLIGNMRA